MKGIRINYTQEQLDFIKANCVTPRAELTEKVNARFGSNFSVDNIKALCTRKGWKTGRTGCFEKGNIPHPNARPKGPNATSFKKGNKPANHRTVQSERVNVDGYVEVKTGEGMHQWKLKHRIVYEQHHNVKLKPSDVVRFKDGNSLNLAPENLDLFTRHEHMLLNKLDVKNMEDEIKPVATTMVRVMSKTHQLEVANN